MTDPGCAREENQDAYVIEMLDGAMLCVICDGMGGAKSGNVASALAAEVFSQGVKSGWKPGLEPLQKETLLRNAAQLANFTVYDQAVTHEDFAGMGTTLCAVLVQDGCATAVNLGDSRLYSVNAEGIRQVTKDHSLVQMMVDRGDLTPEVAKSYPGKNLITRAVGTEPVVMCDIYHKEVSKGEFLLLCTDGLSNVMDDQEILFEVVHGVNKQHCCQRLLSIAKNRGAPDNVTSVLVLI
jgi:protein phosphatase